MARALTEQARATQLDEHTVSSAVRHVSMCMRCGGLMVNDFCMDVLNSVGESRFDAKRCVQCGEVVDPMILENRGTRQEPMTVQLAGTMRSSHSRRNVTRRELHRLSRGDAMKPEEYSKDKGAGVFSPSIGDAGLHTASPAEVDKSLSTPRRDLSSQ
jgi:hypothetical protein